MSCRGWCVTSILTVLLIAGLVDCLKRDPYKVLGVRRTSSDQEIKQAFRRLSRQWHPDKNTSPEATERFQEISAAYEYLSDPARADQPWDFTAPTSRPNRQRFASYPDAAFYYASNTYHTVLDLDPLRIIELLSKWVNNQFEKNRHFVQPIWSGPVVSAVCKGLEAGWKVPQVLEPVLLYAAQHKVIQYKPGQWRSWHTSGVLLELSFWAARQSPCLQQQQHSSSSSSSSNNIKEGKYKSGSSVPAGGSETPAERVLLLELQQRLHLQRRLRQQLLAAKGKADKATAKSSSSSSGGKSASKTGSAASRHPEGSVLAQDGTRLQTDSQQLQGNSIPGQLLWWLLLTATAYSFRHGYRVLFAAGAVSVLGVALLRTSGVMADVAADDVIQRLAEVLESGSLRGSLIGSLYVISCFTATIALPVVLVYACITAVIAVWAIVSCCSIAMAPCLSRTGFGLWIALQLWAYSGHGDRTRSALLLLGMGFTFYHKKGLLLWWMGLLFSPLLFIIHLVRLQLVRLGLRFGIEKLPYKYNLPFAVRQQQLQQQQIVAGGGSAATVSTVSTGAAAAAAADPLGTPLKAAAKSPASSTSDASDPVTDAQCQATSANGTSINSNKTPVAAAAAAAAAVPLPAEQHTAGDPFRRGKRKGGSGLRQAAVVVFGGPWWPATFTAGGLAEACDWWICMLGWELPTRVLSVGVISIKVTLLTTFAALTASSFGLSVNWLTLELLITWVMCRVGLVAGAIWVLLQIIDDVAKWMDPAAYAGKRSSKATRKGRV